MSRTNQIKLRIPDLPVIYSVGLVIHSTVVVVYLNFRSSGLNMFVIANSFNLLLTLLEKIRPNFCCLIHFYKTISVSCWRMMWIRLLGLFLAQLISSD